MNINQIIIRIHLYIQIHLYSCSCFSVLPIPIVTSFFTIASHILVSAASNQIMALARIAEGKPKGNRDRLPELLSQYA